MIRIKNLSLTLFLGSLFCSSHVLRAEGPSQCPPSSIESAERISCKPVRNFSGGYVGINLGVFGENTTLDLSMEGFEVTSGSSDIPPVGALTSGGTNAMGTYEVSHKVNDISHERIYAGDTGFLLDGRGGWSFAISDRGTIGAEIGIMWQGGTSVNFSTTLPVRSKTSFRNDGGGLLVSPTDMNASQNHFIAQTDSSGKSTEMGVDNSDLSLQFSIKNDILVDFLFTCGYAVSPDVFMGVKTGLLLGSGTISAELAGEYTSSEHVIDAFSGTGSSTANTVTWTSSSSQEAEGIMENAASFEAYVLAPMVEVKMTSDVSFVMEAKFILQGAKNTMDFTGSDDFGDISMGVNSSHIMIATLGLQYRFGGSLS